MIERILKHMNIYKEMKSNSLETDRKERGRFLYECSQIGKSARTFRFDGGVK